MQPPGVHFRAGTAGWSPLLRRLPLISGLESTSINSMTKLIAACIVGSNSDESFHEFRAILSIFDLSKF